jgi:thiol-disulfide isomerase/thioredoxin
MTRFGVAPKAAQEESPRQGRPLLRTAQAGAVVLVVGLLGLLVWKLAHQPGGSAVVAAVAAGKKPAAPAFDLPVIWEHTETWPASLQGTVRTGHVGLSELRGYPVVLNFWASWCAHCRDEAPRFEASARLHRGGVVFLGIDSQDLPRTPAISWASTASTTSPSTTVAVRSPAGTA